MKKRYIGKIMKFTLISLVAVILAIGLTMPGHEARAALTKTTAFDTIDTWQAVATSTLAVGNSEDVSGSYSTVVFVEAAYTNANAQSGPDITVEISYATGDDWIELVTFKGQAVTPNMDDLDEGGGATAGDATINVTDSTGDYDAPGELFFVVDTTVAESEVLRVKSEAGNAITLVQDLKYSHVDTEVTTDAVDQWAIKLPLATAFVHVLVNNTDTDATMHWRSFCSKASAL